MEILLARYAQDLSVRALDSADLGRGTWCRASLEDVGAKLNVNVATREALRSLLGNVLRDSAAADSLTRAIVERRRAAPLLDVRELGVVPGFDSSLVEQLTGLLTMRGRGTVDVNTASPLVVATLPGMTPEAATVIAERRAEGRTVTTPDELAELVSPSARSVLYSGYADFVRAAAFAPSELLGVVEGGTRGSPLTARVTITLVPTVGRLAVIRRESE